MEVTMEKLKTATGKEFNCTYFNLFTQAGRLYVQIADESLATIATVFADPAETVQLWHENQYVAQHTRLLAIMPVNGGVRVVLGKE